MAKKALIIDIGETHIRGGFFPSPLIHRGGGWVRGFFGSKKKGLMPEGPFNIPIGSGGVEETLSGLLASIGKRQTGQIFLGLPGSQLSIRVLSLPFSGRKRIDEVLPFEVEDMFLKKREDIIMEAIPLGDKRVLAVAVEKGLLREYLDTFGKYGLEPRWIGSTLFSRGWLLKRFCDGMDGVLLDGGSITAMVKGEPYLFRPLRKEGWAEDIRLTLAYLKAEGVDIETFYYMGEGCNITEVTGPGKDIRPLTLPEDCPQEVAGALALAIHLQEDRDGVINFRKGEFVYTKERSALKRHLTVSGFLASMIVVLLSGEVYIRYTTLTQRLDYWNVTLKQAYQEVFPDDTRVVDSLYQMEAKLKGLEERASVLEGGVNALDMLKGLVSAKPPDIKVELYEVRLERDKIIAKGEAESFEAVHRLREGLATNPGFRDVHLSEVKAKPQGAIFNLFITVSYPH